MSRRGVATAALALALACSTSLTGCYGSVCSAVGYSSTVIVTVEGDASLLDQLAGVQICGAEECSRSPLEVAASSEPSATGFLRTAAEQQPDGTWRYWLMSHDASVTVRALAADDAILGETDAELDWVRVGGSARCGGPTEAAVTLTL